MAILVSGGAGYIGSATVECLLARGKKVVVLDDLARGHRASIDSDVPFYQGKVGDRALVARIAREHKLEACIHFAALAYVGESVSDPALYFENNVAQGIALIGALVQAGLRRFVFSSTCATYGEPRQVPIPEDCPQWPTNPYGWTKLMLERLLHAYDSAYGLRFVALRYFNAAGATVKCGEQHDPEPHLIPNVLRAAAGELPAVSIFGNSYPTPDGTPIRDYIHIADLAEAHLSALQYLRKDGKSDSFNLGTGRGYSVLEVIESARQVTSQEIRVVWQPPRAGDPPELVANAEKAREILGWKPTQSDLHSIIRSAWQWRLKRLQGHSS